MDELLKYHRIQVLSLIVYPYPTRYLTLAIKPVTLVRHSLVTYLELTPSQLPPKIRSSL